MSIHMTYIQSEIFQSQKLKILQVDILDTMWSFFRDYPGRNGQNQKFSSRPTPYQQ